MPMLIDGPDTGDGATVAGVDVLLAVDDVIAGVVLAVVKGVVLTAVAAAPPTWWPKFTKWNNEPNTSDDEIAVKLYLIPDDLK